jgi:acetyltransferase
LSERTVYLRYLEHLKLDQRTAHQRLARLCFIDYARDMALVVERETAAGVRTLLAVGRLSRTRPGQAEFSLLVADAVQGQGVGSELLRRLIEIGRQEGVQRITADIAPGNTAMRAICQKLGFHLHGGASDPTIEAVLEIDQSAGRQMAT